MKYSSILSDVLKGSWHVHGPVAESLLPLVASLVNGNEVEYEHKMKGASPLSAIVLSSGFGSSVEKSTKIAIIPLKDMIVKNDMFCGPVGTKTVAQWIKDADKDPEIGSIILDIDSPGGETSATQYISEVISKTNKPVIAYVGDGMAASAAYWIASHCKEIYASYPTDMIGSIGTYIKLADFKGKLEKDGIKIHEVYATKSTDKNNEFRELLDNGNDTLMRENLLDPLNEAFINAVRSQRPGINEEVFSGKCYFSEDAMKMGLIDGIKSFDEVLQRAAELSQEHENQNTNSNTNHMKIKAAWTAFMTFLGVKEGDVMSEEQAEKVNAELATHLEVKAQLDAATQAKTKAESDLATANAKIKELEEKDPGSKSAKMEGDENHDRSEKRELTSWEKKAAAKVEH